MAPNMSQKCVVLEKKLNKSFIINKVCFCMLHIEAKQMAHILLEKYRGKMDFRLYSAATVPLYHSCWLHCTVMANRTTCKLSSACKKKMVTQTGRQAKV
ncbi:hypothetical protein GDO78_010309 [Eleutherodactylus coqui]|uniref:Uncharacterized protein n=1 Tax=Eleutherodactylus coqui TaxID=57060 RepID=A0A8J6F4I8_ELECQ|nr:hypothetical protein GDO78_010309 [Eleutherodactylus coqui]